MAQNDLSPGFVILFYQVGTRQHRMVLPVKPIAPVPGTIGNELEQKDGDPQSFVTAITAFFLLIKGFYNTGADFIRAELWSKPTPESNPIFVEVHEITDNGTSATATQVDGQAVLTHRTAAGGIHRLYLMESTFPANTREAAPFASGGLNSLSNYLTGDDSVIFGRDNAPLIAPVAFTTKVNDALRKKRLQL